jgi:predicted ATPase/DNA-binding winged helix-turn-helix (wHTH) protein
MGSRPVGAGSQVFAFGRFRLDPGRQLLTRDDTPVRIGSRAFDILTLLVTRSGNLVSKDELIAQVWPDTFVHENNLKVNIATLRRTLAEAPPEQVYIATVPGRGYRFVAPVEVGAADGSTPRHAPAAEIFERLPPLPNIIGRGVAIEAIGEALAAARFVTIIGPGGVGKTTVAGAVARRFALRTMDDVRFVDLTAVADPLLVPEAIAAACEARTAHADPLVGVIDALRSRRTLLVLDNCEHVSRAAAAVAERLFSSAGTVTILATSREALRISAERVHRLPPLARPDADVRIAAEEALTIPAVELFVTRAAERTGYALTDADTPAVCEICRQLDGIPLAIELAATQMAMFEPATLLPALAKSLHVLSYGPRSAPIRQQTLLATLDWSYKLLSGAEASVLRALSTFAGYFNLDGAVAVAASDALTTEDVIASVEALAGKSLVSADYRRGMLRYRLLESTRIYAEKRLRVDGEELQALRRHARYCLGLFEGAKAEWPSRDALDPHAGRADDVRKALAWAFGKGGDTALGIRLAAAAIPLWENLTAIGDCRTWITRALDALRSTGVEDPVLEMKFMAARTWVKVYAQSLEPETEDDWNRCLALADQTKSVEFQLRAHWGLIVHHMYTGRYHDALAHLDQFRSIATRQEEWSAFLDGERFTATAELYLGRLASAKERLDRLSELRIPFGERARMAPYQDRAVTILASQAPLLWLLGYTDQAASVAQEGLEGARMTGLTVSVCNVLALAALPVAWWRGDLEAADGHLAMLRDRSERQGLAIWDPVCRFYVGALMSARGGPDGVVAMETAIADLIRGRFVMRLPLYLGMLAEAMVARNDLAAGQTVTDTALDWIARLGERWCRPEIFRIQGTIRLQQGEFSAAEELLALSLTDAQEIGARSWQLRAATKLSELWLSQGRADEAAQLLASRWDG